MLIHEILSVEICTSSLSFGLKEFQEDYKHDFQSVYFLNDAVSEVGFEISQLCL